MIDFSLTEEQLLLQKTGRDFAEKEIKPKVKEVENRDRTRQTPWDICKDMFRKGKEIGFTTLLIPEKYGGQGLGCIDNVILMEELGTADVAIAASYFNLTTTLSQILIAAGTEEQCEKWLKPVCLEDDHVLGLLLCEADSPGSEVFCLDPNPKLGIKTYAKRKGDEYVVNGSKAAFISNTRVAKSYFLVARTDMTKPASESMSMFYLPADTQGISFGKQAELLGWTTGHNSEVYFDDLRVPKENLIGKEGDALAIFVGSLPFIAIGLAGCFVGLARAAYEYALDYAKQRVSWGKPIIKHQAIGLKLADMYVNTEAARTVVWEAAYHADKHSTLAPTLKSPTAKTFAVETAIKNAESAVKILGGYGVTKEYQTEKFLRDAWVGYPCDATGDILRLGMVDFL